MFWVLLIIIIFSIVLLIFNYGIDIITIFNMRVQNVDTDLIQTYSESYINNLGIVIDVPVKYRFVRYLYDDGFKAEDNEIITLGTFHEWHDTYYIDISVDLYKDLMLEPTVIHETRHMIVEYLRDQGIIDLDQYSEEIAEQTNPDYNTLFNVGIEILKQVK